MLLEEFPFEYVKTIGPSAFEGCESLREIDLSKVEEVGSNAFLGCINLEKVTLASRDFVIKKGVFDNCPKLTIYAKDDGSIIDIKI